jgi:hypothetical protein
MDQAAHEIEAEIDRTRERLESNLGELERKVDVATNWREHFRKRPQLFLGAAFAGGVVLGSALTRTEAGRSPSAFALNPAAGDRGSVQAQAWELWNNIQHALAGVARARITAYLDGLLPEFDEHYRHAEQRRNVDVRTIKES